MAEKLRKNKELHAQIHAELPSFKAKYEEKLADNSMTETSVRAIFDAAEDYFEKQINLLLAFNDSDGTMISPSLKAQHDNFNTYLEGILGAWEAYVLNMVEYVKIAKRKKDVECNAKERKLQVKIASLEESSEQEISELKILSQEQQGQIAELTSVNEQLQAELEKIQGRVESFSSTAAAAETKLRKVAKFSDQDEVTYTFDKEIDDTVKQNSRKAFDGQTRFDFNKEPYANDEEIGNYIGRDGRVYKFDKSLARNGGKTHRKRQRHGRKSRR